MAMPLHIQRLDTINPVININCHMDSVVRINIARRHQLSRLAHLTEGEMVCPIEETLIKKWLSSG